jgi:anti-anti-sigma factor
MTTIQAQVWKGSRFSIDREEGPGVVVFRLAGPFTARDMYGTVTPEALRGMFAALPRDGEPGKQIFDLSQVPYMDSAGLGMIASQLARCQAAGVRLVLAGVSARVLELLRMTKLDGLIPMAATLDEAKAQ